MPKLDTNVNALFTPLGIVRMCEILFSCIAFSLMVDHMDHWGPFGVWCMFTWCFCFTVTLLIVILELTGLAKSVPISWEDFTSAFCMLAALLILTTCVIFPTVYLPENCRVYKCDFVAASTAMSCLCFIAYAIEAKMSGCNAGEINFLKVFEAYVACLIFVIVDYNYVFYKDYSALEWCVAVHAICFIFTMLIIIFTLGRCLDKLPFPADKAMKFINILCVLMYLSAAIIWPIYSFRNHRRPRPCTRVTCRHWDSRVGVTILTILNFIAYVIDLASSIKKG